jgi:hypothetical protein
LFLGETKEKIGEKTYFQIFSVFKKFKTISANFPEIPNEGCG